MKLKSASIVLLLAWSLAPLLWQLYTSFSTDQALVTPFETMANRWTLEHYRSVISANPPFFLYLVNSLFVGILATLLTLIIALPAAYSLSKLSTTNSNIIRIILVGCALFPYVLLFLALLEIARALSLGNNLFALALPYTALSQPLAILLLGSAFTSISPELDDAARVEGLTLINRFRWIYIPLLAPAIASTGILVFLFSWNEYPIALTWISETSKLTLPVAMARIAGSSIHSVPYGAYAAATVLGAIPLILLVIVFQKPIVSGLTSGAVKG
ncbi:carbohydrate ABC transporter permease [Synechococcus sp. BMK-MC-1]|uniref:carbohydrate ABC transporter permease n=1 Tax=Synechococcus sp. BMK-MC-1 TaxID=1442551 RepID=UPI001648A89E|nr:carbohydrate ABC transporter permease [Synechococcus sp. BMK-MC-1]QNI67595.1 ABC-type sugar transport system/ permease component [Synechococcus sp. BMK-MC-1]